MQSNSQGDPNTVSLDAKKGFFYNYKTLTRKNPGLAKVFLFVSIAIYSFLFCVTGALLSSVTGWPWIASTGLIFLARLCLT